MKKFITVLMVGVFLFLGMIPAFADAAAWDEKPVDYYVYVTTPDGGLNFRHGPGVEYAKVFEERIPDGVKLHIVSESGNWGWTKYNGYYGWVALKQTTKVQPTTKNETTTKTVDYYVYVSTPDGGLNFREGPGVDYAKVIEERIPDGVKLHIVTESGDWGMTKYNGYYGWVALKQTTKAQPTTKPVTTTETVETTTLAAETSVAVTENTTESTMLATTATTEAINNTETDNSNAGNMMFLLIGVILVLVVVIAVLLIFIVNKKK